MTSATSGSAPAGSLVASHAESVLATSAGSRPALSGISVSPSVSRRPEPMPGVADGRGWAPRHPAGGPGPWGSSALPWRQWRSSSTWTHRPPNWRCRTTLPTSPSGWPRRPPVGRQPDRPDRVGRTPTGWLRSSRSTGVGGSRGNRRRVRPTGGGPGPGRGDGGGGMGGRFRQDVRVRRSRRAGSTMRAASRRTSSGRRRRVERSRPGPATVVESGRSGCRADGAVATMGRELERVLVFVAGPGSNI